MRIKLLCLLLAVQSCLMSYQTEVHQVITDEAFDLLKSFFPGVEFSELGIQLGQIGDFGLFAHFNGSTWKTYNELYIQGIYFSVAVKNSLVISVGLEGGKAIIVKGLRN